MANLDNFVFGTFLSFWFEPSGQICFSPFSMCNERCHLGLAGIVYENDCQSAVRESFKSTTTVHYSMSLR